MYKRKKHHAALHSHAVNVAQRAETGEPKAESQAGLVGFLLTQARRVRATLLEGSAGHTARTAAGYLLRGRPDRAFATLRRAARATDASTVTA